MTRLEEKKSANANVKVIFALFMVHFIGDFYSSFIGPLMPVFEKTFSLSLTEVGFLAAVTRLLSFLVQPVVGYAADRSKTRFYVLAGPLLPIVFIPLTGLAQSYWMLLIFMAVASIGSSMFHPTAAGMVTTHAGRHHGFCLSIFNMGGTFAFGVGPLVIAFCVERWGLSSSVYTMFFGLAVVVWLFMALPEPVGEDLSKMGFFGSLKTALGPVWRSIFLVWLTMVLRSIVSQSFLIFMPLLYAKNNLSLTTIGLLVSIYTIAGSVSGLLAGGLADRYGFKPLFYICMGLSPIFLILLLYAEGGVAVSGFDAGRILHFIHPAIGPGHWGKKWPQGEGPWCPAS